MPKPGPASDARFLKTWCKPGAPPFWIHSALIVMLPSPGAVHCTIASHFWATTPACTKILLRIDLEPAAGSYWHSVDIDHHNRRFVGVVIGVALQLRHAEPGFCMLWDAVCGERCQVHALQLRAGCRRSAVGPLAVGIRRHADFVGLQVSGPRQHRWLLPKAGNYWKLLWQLKLIRTHRMVMVLVQKQVEVISDSPTEKRTLEPFEQSCRA